MTADPTQGRRDGIGPFVTRIERINPDGLVSRWESRRHRKHLDPASASGSTWWAPASRGWWIAVLFAVGSLLFAVGSIPAYASAVEARWDSVTYFLGSLFFTSAGFLTYREAVDAGPVEPGPGERGPIERGRRRRRKVFVYQPGRIDWWATAVQLVGTLFFNVSTGVAVGQDLTAQAAHRHVWRPDALGSVCFLVASALAWFEVCHGWAALRVRVWGWWIALLNLAGSIAFGVSAVAGYINPSTGQLLNAVRSNRGTFIGAVCFLVGALFLLPERTEAGAASPGPVSG